MANITFLFSAIFSSMILAKPGISMLHKIIWHLIFPALLLPIQSKCERNVYTIRRMTLLQLGELSMIFASTMNMKRGSIFCFTVVAINKSIIMIFLRWLCRHKQPVLMFCGLWLCKAELQKQKQQQKMKKRS